MQSGLFIKNRILPSVIGSICADKNIAFQSFSGDWMLRLEKSGRVRWIIGYKFDLNLSAAGELAQDKVATYMALNAAEIPAVEHYLVRSTPNDPLQWRIDLPELQGKAVVLKPLDGTGGRAVIRYDSVEAALDVVRKGNEPAWAIAPYYDLKAEYRLVILDGVLLLSLEKTQPVLSGDMKFFNLGFGAVAIDIVDIELLESLKNLALRAIKALSLRLAAVDIVRTAEGELRVLEVNDGIMLENYALQSAEYEKRAVHVYDAIVTALFSEK